MRHGRVRLSLLSALLVGGSVWLIGAPASGAAQVSAGVVLDRDGLRHFHLAVGDYFGVPHARVADFRTRSVRHEEIPVVLFLAREARVSPETVLALRERGWSWVDVTLHLNVDPGVFVAHLPAQRGPPYGKAHGYWRKREARYLSQLRDEEIVEFVNLRVVADRYARPVREVIGFRERGSPYVRIHAAFELDAGRRSAEVETRSRDRGGPPARRGGPPAGRGGPPGGRGGG